MTPGDLYRTCKVSAYRLEVMQHYDVPGDEERQRVFHAGGGLLAPGASKQADLQLIAALRTAGRRIGRVHVITRPLTDYIRYELAVYRENVEAGEDVRIADAAVHPDLVTLTTDFVLYDADTDEPQVILFAYTPHGRLVEYTHSQEPAIITRCQNQLDLALSSSVALDEFVAAHKLTG
jgi:hypothetical protein